ncbi:hypothetical protein D3C81_358490 [compost metagenome]
MSSFSDVRKSKGISLHSAAEFIGVPEEGMEYLECNPDELSIWHAAKLSELYRIKISAVKFNINS